MILNTQRVCNPRNRNQQVHPVLYEDNILACNIGTKLYIIFDGNVSADPVKPKCLLDLIDDCLVAIADIKQICIAAIMADQRCIAAAPVKGFRKV